MTDSQAAWHDALGVEDLPDGGLREVVVGGAIVAIANVSGRLHAMDGICAHQGGPLGKGRLDNGCLTCPWHGWQYDVTTGRQRLSETITQRRFSVRIAGDRIEVRLAAPDD